MNNYYIVTYCYPFGQGVNTLQFRNTEDLLYWMNNEDLTGINVIINTVTL